MTKVKFMAKREQVRLLQVIAYVLLVFSAYSGRFASIQWVPVILFVVILALCIFTIYKYNSQTHIEILRFKRSLFLNLFFGTLGLVLSITVWLHY